MRILKLYITFLLCVVSTAAVEHCTPGVVETITFGADYYLNWTNALNPNNCTIQGYVINVFDLDDGTTLQFQTSSYSLRFDMYFLDMCTTYGFEIHALTDVFVLGPSIRVNATTAPYEDIDLSLFVYNVTVSNTNDFEFRWNVLNESISKCVSYYRIVYWDENNSPTDVYVPGYYFSLPHLVPCMRYSIQVKAIVINPDLEGPDSEISIEGGGVAPDVPKLVNMTANKNLVNMFWKVPSFLENRCTLTSLLVVSVGVPYNQTVIRIPIEDSPLRSNVQVTIKDLAPDHAYISYVALQNTAGSSRNVTVSYQTSGIFALNYKTIY